MLTCVAKAPAKVILIGEHWVVHGSRAIAAAVSVYARAVGRPVESGIIVSSRELGLTEDITKCRHLCNLWRSAQYIASIVSRSPWPASIRIESDIPVGAGMGSSAAVAVVFSACYALLGGVKPSVELVLRAAYEAEKVVHGNPSGIDNTVSALGGFIVYRRGEKPRRLENIELRDTRLLIIDTGVPRSTKTAVERFSKRLVELRDLGRELLSLMDRIVDRAIEALQEGSATRFGLLLDLSHGLLNSMGVSHESLEEAIHISRREGAYGAKLTGAGMGGVAIALVPRDRVARVREALTSRGYRVLETDLGVKGYSVTSIQDHP